MIASLLFSLALSPAHAASTTAVPPAAPTAAPTSVEAHVLPGISAATLRSAAGPIDVASFTYHQVTYDLSCKGTISPLACTLHKAGKTDILASFNLATQGDRLTAEVPSLGFIVEMDNSLLGS